ncbi:MAG TPA: hypothetical protein VE825_03490 [Terriglobales bacterium]|jgi:hypothetical protein|nr:hypothetical protein [Terriglobales bacterium]
MNPERLASPPPRKLSPAEQAQLEARIHDSSTEVLREAAGDARLTEELALALLARRDLHHTVLEALSKNGAVMKHRKIIVAVVRHPRTPRYVALPIARHLYTFELMQIALTPGVAADLKLAVEENIVARLESISAGERLALAKRASGRVAAALLMDPEARIIEAALVNPQMTEAWIVKALMADEPPQSFVEMVCRHTKWSLRREIQLTLLRNDKTPLARVLYFAKGLPSALLRDALKHFRLSATVKMYLIKELEDRETAEARQKPSSQQPGRE